MTPAAIELERTLQEMASSCSVPMELWDRHSNLVLKVISELSIATTAADQRVAEMRERCAQEADEADKESLTAKTVWAAICSIGDNIRALPLSPPAQETTK